MPLNDEQSVLDYLKAKLKFWERQDQPTLPPEPEPEAKNKSRAQANTAGTGLPGQAKPVPRQSALVETIPVPTDPSNQEIKNEATLKGVKVPQRSWPVFSLLALALALIGQRYFEPATRVVGNAYIYYFLSAVFLVLAIVRKEWTLAPFPEPQPGNESLKVRRLPFYMSILLAAVTFISCKGNLYTPLNVSLWALTVICFFWAFWIPDSNAIPLWKRLGGFLQRESWQLSVTRWTLLVLTVVGVVIFFRIYHINSVPIEPFSDHAEKLLDVYDVTQGQTHIFFPRNTGREGFQMYLTVAVAWLFGTGLTFLSLKLGTVICGLLTLPYIYLLGKEVGGKRIGLLAVFFAGIAYWPNVISRVGLRFTMYPFFAAPALYYLIRGLRSHNRNDFILCGLFLGMGLHGYTSFRIVPFVVLAAIGLYILHSQSRGNRQKAVVWLIIVALMSLYIFLPLARYWQENPEMFGMRTLSRLGTSEQPLPGPWWQILLSNTWNSLRMFNWDNGGIWVHSLPDRPAFDVVSAALFLIGAALVLVRYIRQRHWLDLFLLVSIPLLQLPSTLSLAFPAENPSLNRPVAAFIPAFLIVAIALDGLLKGIEARRNRLVGTALVWIVMLGLAGWSSYNNYDLVFNQYATEFRLGAWNTSEIADVIRQFCQVNGTVDNAWIVPYPYWVDTRLVGDWLGKPTKDFALWPQDFYTTQNISAAKLFILKPEDTVNLDLLKQLYPQGILSTFHSAVINSGKDFLIFFVPPAN
jgi:4-amino-4-deoxy-L-arabinose transferase-like glycosyltransferase